MQKTVLATLNPGKIREFEALKGIWTLTPQSELGVPEVPETGLTFVENALIKARHASKMTGLPTIGDDSGICVDALNGSPGLYSARFGGIPKLLEALKDVPLEKRTAQFYCVLVFLKRFDDPMPIIAEGLWHGSIAMEPKGTGGHGYDPIFYVPTHKCHSAELPENERRQLNHRGIALKKLILSLNQCGYITVST